MASSGWGSSRSGIAVLLFFASGAAALMYEVLWARDLARLFGTAVHSTAVAVAVFFLGLAAGAAVWGRGAARDPRPLRTYARLEVGVAAWALAFLLLGDVGSWAYAALASGIADRPALLLATKGFVAGAILFPPAFLLGGTLPVLTTWVARGAAGGSGAATRLYAANTLGGALGAGAAGFVLPPWIGLGAAHLVAIAVTLAVAAAAGARSLRDDAAEAGAAEPEAPRAQAPAVLRWLAFQSGFVTLALQVLWTRMFAQVLDNSVYAFAAILVTFLLALAAGAWICAALVRRGVAPRVVQYGMLVSSAVLVAFTPEACHAASGGLQSIGGDLDWAGYVREAFARIAWVILPATIALGGVFPGVLAQADPSARGVGRAVGELACANTLGAIAGSLLAGFVLLDLLGTAAGIRAMAGAHLAAAIGIVAGLPRAGFGRAVAPGCAVLFLLSLTAGPRPPLRFDPRVETLVELREGSAATIAVLRRGSDLRLVLNNHYTLGVSSRRAGDERQGHLPLLLHPHPRSAFFLGLGAGFTANAALRHAPPLERIEVCELVPGVIDAARAHFRPWVGGLFEDPRVRVIAEDGRVRLRVTRERFDVIVGDLFFPWDAGAGDLYTVEHFRTVRGRLAEGGLFTQWLPLYQLSRREFDVIARTFLAVFPDASLWRGDFYADEPIVALVGAGDGAALDPEALRARLRPPPAGDSPLGNLARGMEEVVGTGRAPTAELGVLLSYYVGNLGAAAGLFQAAPVNTDDVPRIEYDSPVTHRRQHAGAVSFLVGEEWIRFQEELAKASPIAEDPRLAAIPARLREIAGAALHLVRSEMLRTRGDRAGAAAARDEFVRRSAE